jgi:hypothetical protein
LHRAELTTLERSSQVAEWVTLSEGKTGGKPVQPEQVSKGGRGNKGGVAAASRELGVDRSEVNRSIKIADISDEAKEAATAAGLANNQTALLKVAAAPVEQQVEVVAAWRASVVWGRHVALAFAARPEASTRPAGGNHGHAR